MTSRHRRTKRSRTGAVVLTAVALLATGATGAIATTQADAPRASSTATVGAQSALPDDSWWGVRDGKTTTPYNEYNEGYQFGCNGDQRHKGLDVGAETGTTIHAWASGEVVGTGYDDGGYHRWIQVYFPSIDMSMTLGHLQNGSQMKVGSTFEQGDVWAKVGTVADGLNHSHVHYRASKGNHGEAAIGPCEDMDPFVIWDALGLPA